MIIPIAIDLSNHDSVPEYKHDSADFAQLSKILHEHPFLLIHDSSSIEQSQFYQLIEQLPQKSRDAFIRICRKIPRQAVPNWNGDVEQINQHSLHTIIKIAAMSKSTFHVLFEYDDETFVAPHPTLPEIECATWKAINQTNIYTQMHQLKSTTIISGGLRSTLWKERFAPIISAEKWKRIKLVDRYLFLKYNLDFTAIDFMLGKIDDQLTHPTEIEIFVQHDKYKGYDRRSMNSFDYYPDIVSHLQRRVASRNRIAAIRIYSYNNDIGSSTLHDRFMYLYSTRELLCEYAIGKGFKVMQEEHINEASTFELKMYPVPSENNLYTEISALTPPRSKTPDYKEGKVSAYIIP